MNSCTLYASQDAATVLGTVTDSLTRKALRGAETLVNFDEDFKAKQAVYLKDLFEVWRLSDNRKINRQMFARGKAKRQSCLTVKLNEVRAFVISSLLMSRETT